MQIRYFDSAWGDIKNSPGWFGKICLLALLNFIPIFGQIVTFGYLFGWAREMAWGTHEPLPRSVFENTDGKFWRRGWFALVTTFVFSLVPGIVVSIGSDMQSAALLAAANASRDAAQGSIALGGVGSLLYFIGLAGSILMMLLAWIGCMRASIYDRLSAGFQFGKIWKMFRQDMSGIMKIFGMDLIVSLIIGVVLSIVIGALFLIVIMAGAASFAASGMTASQLQHMSDAQLAQFLFQMLGSVGIVGIIALLVTTFLTMVASVFVDMLVFRALGYWTMQFDVPHWRGQDDLMPFEVASTTSQSYTYAPPGQPQASPVDYQQQVAQHVVVPASQQNQETAQAGPIIVPVPSQPLSSDTPTSVAGSAVATAAGAQPLETEPDSAPSDPDESAINDSADE